MVEYLTLFGKKIKVRNQVCIREGEKPSRISPWINLYIVLSRACQAHCPFCSACSFPSPPFDFYKLYYVLTELQKKNIRVPKINFTGGEPTIDPLLLYEIGKDVRDRFPQAYITLNTNGYNLKELSSKDLFFDSYALSRHHYDEEKNIEIFKTPRVFTNQDIKDFPQKDKLHLRCNLIKGYIDSTEEIMKYLDYYSDECNISSFGFVPLWPLNDFCKENKTENLELLKTIPDTLHTETKIKPNKKCSCWNYLYTSSNGNISSLYSREDNDSGNCASTLIYDVNCLKDSFSGEAFL